MEKTDWERPDKAGISRLSRIRQRRQNSLNFWCKENKAVISVRMVVLVLGHSQHREVLVGKRGYFLGITRKGEPCGVLVTPQRDAQMGLW